VDVTVVVATFGNIEWSRLARHRAIPSAEALGVQIVAVHGETLHTARNTGLDQVDTPWVVFLDADDQLEAGYLDAMAAGHADVRAPAVRYIHRGGRCAPLRIPRVAGHGHDCHGGCLPEGNWIVVGAAVRTALVRRVGGWRDFRWSEDWDLWLRCWLAGGTVQTVPNAVYRAYLRPDSRNRALSGVQRLATHREIERANGLTPGGFLPDGTRPIPAPTPGVFQ
jgi:GT2 family glycosyltransferase